MSEKDQPEKDKYEVNIEGDVHAWGQPTITVPELRVLGHLPEDQPVLQVNLETNVETTLDESAVVELKPGHGFGRKVGFKRG